MRRSSFTATVTVGALWCACALTPDGAVPVRAADAPPPIGQHKYGNVVFTPMDSKNPIGTHHGNLLVLVSADVYSDVKGSIATYAADLAAEGYKVTVQTVEVKKGEVILGRTYWYLKAGMRAWWHECADALIDPKAKVTMDDLFAFCCHTGVVLVGDLPAPEVHHRGGVWLDEKGGPHPYEGIGAYDIFLTDFDGHWTHMDASFNTFISTYDTVPAPDSECNAYDANAPEWVPPASGKLGKAGARPEIFLGRISAHHVAQVGGKYSKAREVELLKDYFARNHKYRTTPAPMTGGAKSTVSWPRLAYYDDPWSGVGPKVGQSMQSAWGGTLVANDAAGGDVRYVNSTALTTKADFEKRVTGKQHLWVDLMGHACPWDHLFITSKGDEWLSSDEVKTLMPKSYFYLLQGCEACDYRQESNLGETYLFHGGALGVIGHTGAGPVDTAQVYAGLGEGMSLGEAVMYAQQTHGKSKTWPTNFAHLGDGVDPKRYYNVTTLGDPTLRAPHPVAAKVIWNSAVYQVQLNELVKGLGVKTPQEVAAKLHTASVERARLEVPGKLTEVKPFAVHGADYTQHQRAHPSIDPQWRQYADKGVEIKIKPVVRDFGLKLPPRP